MKKLLCILLLLPALAFAQNVRYDSPFPSISPASPPFLIANVPPNSPTIAVCQSPANQVPCTNYATTYTSANAACPNGAQDTPQPQPSACQPTGDGQGNIGFWAAPGTYDYTVCISNNCFGPYTVTLGGSGGSGGSPNQVIGFTNASSAVVVIGSENTAVVWDCWDTGSGTSIVLDPTVFPPTSPSYAMTFLFAVPTTGFCNVNSSGGGGGGSGPTVTLPFINVATFPGIYASILEQTQAAVTSLTVTGGTAWIPPSAAGTYPLSSCNTWSSEIGRASCRERV